MINKQCNKCGSIKPIEDFPINPRCVNPSGTCIECMRANNAEKSRTYRQRNKQAINQRLAERRKNKDQNK